VIDALRTDFREYRVRRDPGCPVCGDQPTIRRLTDYDRFCGLQPPVDLGEIPQISAPELKRRIDRGDDLLILDVRNSQEYEICRIKGSRLIPLTQLREQFHSLDPLREIVVHSKSGDRSLRAIEYLQQAGFQKLIHLPGGILDWSQTVDPSMPIY
jgi:adenylyltransferase/sulfurtransferase